MSDFAEIEERRERNDPLHYEEWLSRRVPEPTPEEAYDDVGYELDDPKHPTYHDRLADLWDMREGK
jgi:hypothetical protein